METVRDRNIIRIQIGRSPLNSKNTLVTADTVRVDLVELCGKPGVFPLARKGKDIDARHQGMPGSMALRTVDFRVKGRLFPERGFFLLMVTGDAEFLFGRGISGQSDGGINGQYRQDSP